jgi:hypothetical protein
MESAGPDLANAQLGGEQTPDPKRKAKKVSLLNESIRFLTGTSVTDASVRPAMALTGAQNF